MLCPPAQLEDVRKIKIKSGRSVTILVLLTCVRKLHYGSLWFVSIFQKVRSKVIHLPGAAVASHTLMCERTLWHFGTSHFVLYWGGRLRRSKRNDDLQKCSIERVSCYGATVVVIIWILNLCYCRLVLSPRPEPLPQ